MTTQNKSNEHAVLLPPDEIPTSWYNIQADLPELLPPPLDPRTLKPVDPAMLERIFAKELILQEVSRERYIKIPDEVLDAYLRIPRPTPLIRAKRLERFLKTPAQIYYKCEYVSPPGSHKPNTAIAQAYYNKKQGIEHLISETGAGQWGTALAMASSLFDLKCRLYMVRCSYQQKPGRRTMAEIYGAEIYPSPSDRTAFGKKLLNENPNHPGTLGIAISEALEDTLSDEKARYCLGSVLNHVLLHQTIIGQEAKKQFEMIDVYPDVICGCVGGGSNYSGFSYPFMMDKLQHRVDSPEFVACEAKAVPHTTRGTYTYSFGDTAQITPLLKMLTLGHEYACPPIHAGGLRYHGMAPSISYLIQNGFMKSVAYHQTEVFEAARIFAQTEGMIPAPEAAHNIKYAIDEALKCKRTGENKIIAFNNCGHGLLDLSAYESFLAGKLQDYEPVEIRVPKFAG